MATYKRLRSGNWNAQIHVKGVRESYTAPTKREVELWAAARQVEVLKQVAVSGGAKADYSVDELLELYKSRVSVTKRGKKWEVNRIKRFQRDTFAALRCREISPSDIADWMFYRQFPNGKYNEDPVVSGATVVRDMNLLSHIFSYGVTLKWLNENPCSGVKRPEENEPRDFMYSDEQIQMVRYQLQWFEDGPATNGLQRLCVMFLFALETAMRISEMCRLTLERIDNRVARLGWTKEDMTKNGRRRFVPLSKRAMELLSFLPETGVGEPIFDLKAGTASSTFYKKVTAELIPEATFHDTRHYACTVLAEKLSVLDLAKMTGHTDLNLLLRVYYNKRPDDVVAALD